VAADQVATQNQREIGEQQLSKNHSQRIAAIHLRAEFAQLLQAFTPKICRSVNMLRILNLPISQTLEL
jgi:hypothetical protein